MHSIMNIKTFERIADGQERAVLSDTWAIFGCWDTRAVIALWMDLFSSLGRLTPVTTVVFCGSEKTQTHKALLKCVM